MASPTPGLVGRVTTAVSADDTAVALGSGDVPVLATPRVVALVEAASVAAVHDTLGLMAVLGPHLPLFVTDIDRRSLLADPAIARAVEEGVARDGSSGGLLYVSTAHWERDGDATTLRLGALQAPAIADALRGRLPFGRELILQTDDTILAFRPAEAFAVEEPSDGVLEVHVPPAALDDLTAAMPPTAGRAAIASLPGLTVEIVPTAMKDRYGKETGEVVG